MGNGKRKGMATTARTMPVLVRLSIEDREALRLEAVKRAAVGGRIDASAVLRELVGAWRLGQFRPVC